MGDEIEEKGPPGIIIDECLCFILNKYSYVDVETMIILCANQFDEKDIEASKDILFSYLHEVSDSTEFKRRRNRNTSESKSVRNIRDIWQLLQEKGDIEIPKFVAYDLGKLPAIHFDHIDVTVLLRKIQNGNTSIKFLKEGMNTLSDSNKSLCEIVASLEGRLKKLEENDPSVKPKVLIGHENSDNDDSSEDKEVVIDDREKVIDVTIENMPFICTECDVRFKTDADLKIHNEGSHVDKIITCYNCPMCEHKAESDNDLSIHLLSHKPYECKVKGCVFRSASQDKLKTHMRTHTEEKLYNCNQCHSKFDKYEELELHNVSMHTDENCFECTECEFKCNEKTTLENHKTIHTGENPHKCPFCNISCSDLISLQTHISFHLPYKKEDNRQKSVSVPGTEGFWHTNESARQHFIDSFSNKDGFSYPTRNGKPLSPKDFVTKQHVPVLPHIANKPKSSSNIGTGKSTSLGIQNRKFRATVFATRYEPDTEIGAVKKDLETNLYRHTGIKHIVTVEKITTRYEHYSSFKVTCFCENTAVFMNSDIWPSGTLYKWWRHSKIRS